MFILFFVFATGGGMVTVMMSYLVSSLFAILLVSPFIIISVKKTKTEGDAGNKLLLGLFKEHGKFQIGLRFFKTCLTR